MHDAGFCKSETIEQVKSSFYYTPTFAALNFRAQFAFWLLTDIAFNALRRERDECTQLHVLLTALLDSFFACHRLRQSKEFVCEAESWSRV